MTSAGRLVVLDFGIVSDLRQYEEWADQRPMGTIQYMAPEQAAGKPISAAADWYSVGVLLYQALTGQLPFIGTPEQILAAIQQLDPLPVHSLVPAVPYDLDLLCSELLRRDPLARPTGAQILERLQGQSETRQALAYPPSVELFVGRQQEFAALTQAFADMRGGQGVTLLLSGESGVGKSFLLRHFLGELAQSHPEIVVLSGRCYERESVPYKAIDALIDRLSVYLQRQPPEEVQALLPAHFGLLAKLFLVLEPLLPKGGGAALQISEPAEMRRYAFSALRELLHRLARKVPLILVIDDLQWADTDSFVLLGELLRPPGAPPMLLLGTVRNNTTREVAPDRLPLQQLPGEIRHFHIQKLPESDARALAMQLLGQTGTDAQRLASEIAREAQGHPLFIDELVRGRQPQGGPNAADAADAAPLRLDEALWLRAEQLDSPARSLLAVIALAGLPIPQEMAMLAAAADPVTFDAQMAKLRAARLVRTSGARRSDTVEPFHDRVRESVQAHLSEKAQRTWHGRLALALESSMGTADPQALVIHWQGAGHPDRAASYAKQAAEQASAALAFERAARLYRQALELGTAIGSQRRELLIHLAEALHNADRGREAARIFIEAAEGAPAQQASILRRRAADQFLRSGHYREGFELVRQALHDLGLSAPSSMAGIMGSLLLHRSWLGARGLGFRQRAESELPSDELARIDALMACSNTFGVVDPPRGIEFSARQVLRALRAGEPSRVAVALAMTANGMIVSGGQRAWERGQSLMEQARGLARQTDNPYLNAYLVNIDGIMHWTGGRFRPAMALMDQAEKLYRERCIGVGWDLATLRILTVEGAYSLGDLQRMSREFTQAMEDAGRRGDLYLQTCLGTASAPLLDLLRDEPESCRQHVFQHLRNWRYPGFSHYQIIGLWRRAQSHLYEGQASLAHRCLHQEMPAQGKLILRFVQCLRINDLELRGRCAIAAATEDPSRRQTLILDAELQARKLAAEDAQWAHGLAAILRSGIAAVRGGPQAPAAMHELCQAETLLCASGMMLLATAVRRRRGQLLDSAEGRELFTAADQWMHEQGIVNPVRLTAMLVPGFPA